jgi:hypothetical protein
MTVIRMTVSPRARRGLVAPTTPSILRERDRQLSVDSDVAGRQLSVDTEVGRRVSYSPTRGVYQPSPPTPSILRSGPARDG